MNRANIQTLISRLQSIDPRQFDMATWVTPGRAPEQLLHNCGTCGCIGGWTNALFGGAHNEIGARAALGLTAEQAGGLFYPTECNDWSEITPTVAIRTLQHLLDTGEVTWTLP